MHHASEGSLYGLWMIEELAEHGYKLNASQIYPLFHRLERQGCLKRTDKVVDGKEDARNSVESGGSPEPPVYAALACDSGGCGRSFSSAASSFGRSR